MKKILKVTSRIFAIVFLILTVASFVGVVVGAWWQVISVFVCAILSAVFFYEGWELGVPNQSENEKPNEYVEKNKKS